MLRIHLKALIFLVIVVAVFMVIRTGLDAMDPIKNGDLGEEVDNALKSTKQLDVVVAGTSHAIALRDLGLDEDYRVLNLGQSGLGVAPMIVKLRYTMDRAEIRNLVVVVDEWQISSQARSQSTYVFDQYKFDPELFKIIRQGDFDNAVSARFALGVAGNLPNLIYSRIVGFNKKRAEKKAFEGETTAISSIDPLKARGRLLKLFQGSTEEAAIEQSQSLADFLVAIQDAGKTRVLVLFPPLPEAFRAELPPYNERYKEIVSNALIGAKIEILDLSEVLPEITSYSDEDHPTSTAARKLGREHIVPHLRF